MIYVKCRKVEKDYTIKMLSLGKRWDDGKEIVKEENARKRLAEVLAV